jgi:uncharacterized protein (DUF2249 family)
MIINANTKIAKILKENPETLEAIISINSKFEKLRNPLLRRLMAARTTIGMASQIGGCNVEQFYEKLQPLGFEIDRETVQITNKDNPKLPAFFNSITNAQIVSLDVRSAINSGQDPLNLIIEKVKSIPVGGGLKITNSFEPTPLISLLNKQGFESFVDTIDHETVETYFYKKSPATVEINEEEKGSQGWDELLEKYKDKMVTVDVRNLEMPQPMMTILGELEKISGDKALFVYHKRIPVFLLPELKEKEFDFRINEIAPNEVHMLIFKD